jgi:hypothetical protein
MKISALMRSYKNLNLEKIIIAFLMMFIPIFAIAETDQMQSEIDHLIVYIRNSDCKFIRNAKEHSSEEAVEHILKKFDYFKARITTTEQFIDYCAAKSTLSGKSYKIGCPGQEAVESKQWLLKELNKFRNK